MATSSRTTTLVLTRAHVGRERREQKPREFGSIYEGFPRARETAGQNMEAAGFGGH